MRNRELAIALALAAAIPVEAWGQQTGAPNAQVKVEQKAAADAIVAAEKRINAGEARGPESEACRLMGEFFLHSVKAAVAAGAKSRIADWAELTLQEQAAVKEWMKDPHQRNLRLRQHACTASSN